MGIRLAKFTVSTMSAILKICVCMAVRRRIDNMSFIILFDLIIIGIKG